jgi:hypothetical protein
MNQGEATSRLVVYRGSYQRTVFDAKKKRGFTHDLLTDITLLVLKNSDLVDNG